MKRDVILHFEVNNDKLKTYVEGTQAAICAGLDCLIHLAAAEMNMTASELVEMIYNEIYNEDIINNF